MKNLLIVVFAFASMNANAQLSSQKKSDVDKIFSMWSSENSPGAAVAIIQDRNIIYSKGYGIADLEHTIPITDSTIFYIGSVSKQFVAMCILLLEEQGKLSPNDPVQRFLPDFPTYDSKLTIGHFIHHTSGVRDNLTLWSLAGNNYLDHIDKAEMYELIRRQKHLNFRPGEKHLYSNSCYFMLGLIIEKASGQSLRQFAEQNIFAPLGMRHTFFNDDNTVIIRNRAFSYSLDNGQIKNQIMRYDLVGSGGMYSSVKDLYLWDQNFYHNKLGSKGQELIDRMHQEGLLNDGKSSGYAFALVNGTYRGLRTVSHSGALAGYRSQLIRFPEKKTSVIVLGNLGQMDVTALSYRVADIVLAADLGAAPISNPSQPPTQLESTNALSPPSLAEYVGSFFSDELEVKYVISEKNGELFYRIKNQASVRLKPFTRDVFANDNMQITFTRNKKGAVTGFSVDAGRVTDLKFERQD